MSTEIAISLDNELLAKLDSLVEKKVFPSLDIAIQSAVKEKLARLEDERFVEECQNLNPRLEQAMAEEGFSEINLTSLQALDGLRKHLQVDANKAAEWMAIVREGRR